eukprot:2708852-Amphidinium_carterae.1
MGSLTPMVAFGTSALRPLTSTVTKCVHPQLPFHSRARRENATHLQQHPMHTPVQQLKNWDSCLDDDPRSDTGVEHMHCQPIARPIDGLVWTHQTTWQVAPAPTSSSTGQ